MDVDAAWTGNDFYYFVKEKISQYIRSPMMHDCFLDIYCDIFKSLQQLLL